MPAVAAIAVASVARKAPAPTRRSGPPKAAPTTPAGRFRADGPPHLASTTQLAATAPRQYAPAARSRRRGPTATAAPTTDATTRLDAARHRAPSSNGGTYNRSYAYSKPGYAPPRAPYYRSHSKPYYGKPYYGKHYAKPYYYHGYRGVYGYGHGYRHTRIVTVYPWRPYYYRPHFSIGVYYGAGGVYDYGYTPSYYYDPIPGRSTAACVSRKRRVTPRSSRTATTSASSTTSTAPSST